MWMVVGLGNPGRRYEGSRHNMGFEVLDKLAARCGVKWRKSWRAPARVGRGLVGAQAVRLVKPRTFMNRSGEAVKPLLKQYGLRPADLIVVVDDADLPPGRLRVRARGGAGNHNGLKSIVGALNTGEFIRVRVGVGAKPEAGDMVEHVLAPVGAGERGVLEKARDRAVEAVECLITKGVEQTMNRFNQAPEKTGEHIEQV